MNKFAKGLISYEEYYGLCTCLSFHYINCRLAEARKFASDDYEELKDLFRKFERNIDKEKKAKLISTFIRS